MTLEEQPKEKLEESYGTTRNTVIVVGLHTWTQLEVRDKLFTVKR